MFTVPRSRSHRSPVRGALAIPIHHFRDNPLNGVMPTRPTHKASPQVHLPALGCYPVAQGAAWSPLCDVRLPSACEQPKCHPTFDRGGLDSSFQSRASYGSSNCKYPLVDQSIPQVFGARTHAGQSGDIYAKTAWRRGLTQVWARQFESSCPEKNQKTRKKRQHSVNIM